MEIELLYFDGCPNYQQALENLKRALAQLGLEERIDVTKVENNDHAVTKRFLGSPSIRVNGRDIEYEDESETVYSMRCRRYKSKSGIQGYPDIDAIKTAVLGELDKSDAHD